MLKTSDCMPGLGCLRCGWIREIQELTVCESRSRLPREAPRNARESQEFPGFGHSGMLSRSSRPPAINLGRPWSKTCCRAAPVDRVRLRLCNNYGSATWLRHCHMQCVERVILPLPHCRRFTSGPPAAELEGFQVPARACTTPVTSPLQVQDLEQTNGHLLRDHPESPWYLSHFWADRAKVRYRKGQVGCSTARPYQSTNRRKPPEEH
jgi:hypothetical protein